MEGDYEDALFRVLCIFFEYMLSRIGKTRTGCACIFEGKVLRVLHTIFI